MEPSSSPDILRKSEWGPRLWNFLHACSFAFPKNPTPAEVEAFENLLRSLKVLLPCPKCRVHYNEYLDRSPPNTSCGDTLKEWLVNFHNAVNERVGKPTMTIDEARAQYDPQEEGAFGKVDPCAIGFAILGGIFVGIGISQLVSRTRY